MPNGVIGRTRASRSACNDRTVRARAAIAILLAAATGCARVEDAGVPVECREGPASIRRALERAPGQVRLGEVALSSCLAPGSDAADLQEVGASFLSVAEDLARVSRRRPNGPAATQLGYLIGAVRRGATATQGIHDELRRRIEQELVGVDTSAAAFAAGERAGRRSG